jgi:serine/threonine protein kinase
VATTSERIADYELVEELDGGMGGHVHLARPPGRLGLDARRAANGQDVLVAVKVFGGALTRERFLRAARLLHRFTAVARSTAHGSRGAPQIVEIYEAGRQGSALWFSMPHHPLGSLVDPASPLSRHERIAAVATVARGAHALHEAGLTHGGIKPTNVLLADDGAKLADIDLRTCLYPGLTLYATPLLADVEFTDPAVIKGNAASRASDIWSLGMTLHRVLAGQPVYPIGPDDDMLSTIRHISTYRYQLAESLTADEGEVVRACLAADPADRLPTAAALAAALEDLP